MNNNDLAERIAEIPGVEEDTLLAAATPPNAAAVVRPVSGLYQRSSPPVLPSHANHDLAPLLPIGFAAGGMREELRLDIDGNFPQQVASGTIYRALNSRVDWVAKLAPEGADLWTGTVSYKNGDLGAFPHTNIKIQVIRSGSLAPQGARVIFSGGGAPNAERAFGYESPFFRTVEFEFDHVKGVAPVTQMITHGHPNRPGSLANETLTIPRVFQRAGFDVKVSPAGPPIPVTGAGVNARWSDMEMHDAMQQYWSRFANRSQWALWVFYAALHEEGTSLGGIMFDDIGGNHRQGTAIFTDSFIANPPAGDAAPAAWVERMKFWCACHEMGHAFNLAHAWQKALGTPWIPLANEPEARSFMNYPYNVSGGQTAFFKNFHYRFSNDELLFLRHAPEPFVQMGNADWFDHHAFEQANVLPEPTFRLELRVNRPSVKGAHQAAEFEFMEPVVLELKLSNVSGQPQIIPAKLLAPRHELTVIVKRMGRPARQVIPFATYCWKPEYTALEPEDSIYESLFASVGKGGWDIAAPGYYMVQVALHRESEDIVSNPLMIRVAPPRSYAEEYLAQDYFSEDVGRILTFDGSHVLEAGNNTLSDVVAQMPDRRVAVHAQVAQASALLRDYKEVVGATIRTRGADLTRAQQIFDDILKAPSDAAESLGHIDFNHYMTRLSKSCDEAGAKDVAAGVLDTLGDRLSTRNVASWVIDEIRERRAALNVADRTGTSKQGKRKQKSSAGR